MAPRIAFTASFSRLSGSATAWRIAACLGILGVAVALGSRITPDDIDFHIDTGRDLLLARDCSVAAHCASLGPESAAFFYHGFAWHRFLELFMIFGVPLRLIPAAVVLLHSLGTLLLFSVLERTTSRLTAIAAAMIYCLITFDVRLIEPLWVHTPMPFIMNAFIWSADMAFRASGWRRAAAALAAAFILSLGTQAHDEIFLFMPGIVLFLILFLYNRRGVLRPFLTITSLMLVMAFSWLLLSADSLSANIRLLYYFPSWASEHLRYSIGRPMSLEEGLRFSFYAVAILVSPFTLKREQMCKTFEGFLVFAAASYLLGLGTVALAIPHGIGYWNYAPLLPFVLILLVRVFHPLVLRHGYIAVLIMGMLAWQVAGMSFSPPVTRLPRERLQLGEIRSLVNTLEEWGYDANSMYRHISSGQGVYMDLVSGLWLYAPCLADTAVLGNVPDRKERVVLVAVPQGFPIPAAMKSYSYRRVQGAGREFFLIRLPNHVRLDEFSVVDGTTAAAARRFGVKNRGFQQRCWDGNWVTFGVRNMISWTRATSTMQFSMRVPRNASKRILYLPGIDARGSSRDPLGRPRDRCAGSIVEVRGIAASVSQDRRSMEWRGTKQVQDGHVRIAWPTQDRECFTNDNLFYPMPILELPLELFVPLRDVLD